MIDITPLFYLGAGIAAVTVFLGLMCFANWLMKG